MDRNKIQNTADLHAILETVESNVISTGAGNVPNFGSEDLKQFFHVAEVAAMTTNTNPLARLDSELLRTHSPRLDRLSSAITKGIQAARFKPKASIKETKTPTAQIRAATTIRTETGTVIRPVAR